jgi:hypothetical protein
MHRGAGLEFQALELEVLDDLQGDQRVVGFSRITSSTALPPRSGRWASSRHWSGWPETSAWQANWFRVVSKAPKISSTSPSRSS